MWKVQPRPGRPILGIIRERLISFAMVLSAGLLLLASLIVTAVLNAVAKYLSPASLPGGVAMWQGLNWLVSLAFVTLLFALIFKVVPDVHVRLARRLGRRRPDRRPVHASASTCSPST